jgi:alpha-tubulin suppressor-like RCC1 family protein
LCWGANEAGQLGTAAGAATPEPALVPGVTGAVSIAAGLDFSCAALGDGSVRCWGANTVGQIGDGDVSPATRPATTVAFLDGVRTLSAFWQHACAIRSDDTLWCWGGNGAGQLGNATTTDQRRPVRVIGLTAVTRVGTGLAHSCAVTRAAGLYCWGDNGASQLGSTVDGPVTAPAQVAFLSDPIAVAVGLQHTCAIRNSGAVYCWGQNERGQLGVGTQGILSLPNAIPRFETGAALAAGSAFTCARTRDGALFCWGDNHFGQLGVGSAVLRSRPVEVPDVAGAVYVSAGAGHTCAAVDGAGNVPLCWGANQAGQLGSGAKTDRAGAAPIAGEIAASAIAAGGAHTCAIDSLDTRMWCWGRGNAGQLGSTPLVDRQPSQVPALTGITAVSAGAAHTCAIASGVVSCFGDNAAAAPGAVTLAAVAARSGAISAGGAHTCAITQAGELACWGRSVEDQLGPGEGPPSLPRIVPGMTGTRAVAAGSAHTCAIAGDERRVWCFGANEHGQLGRDASASVRMPAAVDGLADVEDISAGAVHTCARRANGTVVCWGGNTSGQLGDGVQLTVGSPQLVRVTCE